MGAEVTINLQWEPVPGLCIVEWNEAGTILYREFGDRDEALGFGFLLSQTSLDEVLVHYTIAVDINGRSDLNPICLTASFKNGAILIQ